MRPLFRPVYGDSGACKLTKLEKFIKAYEKTMSDEHDENIWQAFERILKENPMADECPEIKITPEEAAEMNKAERFEYLKELSKMIASANPQYMVPTLVVERAVQLRDLVWAEKGK